MEQQNYSNHIRYYTQHHFIFYPAMGIGIGACVYLGYRHPGQTLEWVVMGLLFLSLAWLSLMMRQHYALGNQNRIVRLEMRLRYYQITGKRFEEIESRLSLKQIAALRFASDDELPILINRAITENLSPGKIKRSIKNWLADEMRL